MSGAAESLKTMSVTYGSTIAQIESVIGRMQRSDPKQYAAARRQLDLCASEQRLVQQAEKLAEGDESAIKEIEGALAGRATHAHTRMIAAMILGIVDSDRALTAIYGRIVDKQDPDPIRYFCAMQLGNSTQTAARTLLLKAIDHPTTDDEFDGDPKMRESMRKAGMPLNLRALLVVEVMDLTGGSEALAARVRAYRTFATGWLLSVLVLWEDTEDVRYIQLAATVLRDKGVPEKLRISAATALHIMRKQSRGKVLFPREVWDALRAVWVERDWGELHSVVGEVLKMQGAR